MPEPTKSSRRHFQVHESAHAAVLNGLPLATFWQRFLGYLLDLIFVVLLWFPAEGLWRYFILREHDIHLAWDFHEKGNIVAALVYWGAGNYFLNGQTPGKWVARTRIVSLTSKRLGPWQSVERALGYGAAVLEGGFGFLQFFWDRNRMCAQDRLAETIVVDVRQSSQPAAQIPASHN